MYLHCTLCRLVGNLRISTSAPKLTQLFQQSTTNNSTSQHTSQLHVVVHPYKNIASCASNTARLRCPNLLSLTFTSKKGHINLTPYDSTPISISVVACRFRFPPQLPLHQTLLPSSQSRHEMTTQTLLRPILHLPKRCVMTLERSSPQPSCATLLHESEPQYSC